jgi:hypothetical protein
MDRYEGRPLARLVECYVLDAIGQLHDQHRRAMEKMEPHLARIYKTKGSWQQIVASVMEFPETMPATIERLWEKNLGIAKAQGAAVIPDEFAMAFVDQNFPELLSDEGAQE